MNQDAVAHLCEVFTCYLNEDSTVRENAEQEAIKYMYSDIVSFISTCASIVLMDNPKPHVVFFAMRSLKCVFAPTLFISIDQIGSKWLNIDPKIRELVKLSLLRGLTFVEEAITNMTSKCFCNLFNIEKLGIFPLIESVINLAEGNHQAPERVQLAALDVLNEISGPMYLGAHTAYSEVREMLQTIHLRIGILFAENDSRFSDRYVIAVASIINTLVQTASPIYQQQNVLNSLLLLIEQYLMKNGNDELYSVICMILLNLTKANYWCDNFDFSKIRNIAAQQVLNQTNEKKLCEIIEFWTELAKFEIKCSIKHNKNQELINASKSYFRETEGIIFAEVPQIIGLTDSVVDMLADQLLGILATINPNDVSAEDVSVKRPHMYASCCLKFFYKLSPLKVFTRVKQIWGSQNHINAPWPYQHMLMLTVDLICNKPTSGEVLNFLTAEICPSFQIFKYIIEILKTSQIPILLDTTLYVLKACIREYNIYLDDDSFPILMDALKQLSTTKDIIIYERILYLICIIIQKSFRISNFEYVEKFHSVILEIIYIGINNPENPEVFVLACRVLETFIRLSPETAYGVCMKIMNISQDFLNNSLNPEGLLTNGSTCFKQQYHISIVAIFLERFVDKIPANTENTIFIARKMFEIMNQKDPDVFHEALICITRIINGLKNSSKHIIADVLPFAEIALTSQSPRIITETAFTLSSLYREVLGCELPSYDQSNNAQKLIEKLPDTIALIMNMLNNPWFTRDFYPLLLLSLSNILSCSGTYIKPETVEEILAVYLRFTDMPLDMQKPEDITFGNNLFEATFAGLAAVLKVLSIHNEDRFIQKNIMRQLMGSPPKRLLDLNEYTEQSLKSFCQFLIQYNCFFAQKGNVFLHRSTNKKILLHAIVSEDAKLSELGKETLRMLCKA